MQRDFTVRKRVILTLLGLVLAADAVLGIYSWQLASGPYTADSEFKKENLQLALLRGDIKKAQSVKEEMPTAKQDCDKFERSLPPASTGSSSLVSELDDIARKSGLQIVVLTTKPQELAKRALTEVDIDATVSGDYASVVKFVNGLQRSHSFYILDGLALSSEGQTQPRTPQTPHAAIRVALHLRTYFREAA